MPVDSAATARGTLARVVVLTALVAAWFALTRPWLFGGYTVPWDAEAHFRPQLAFLAHAIHAGESFLWNPWIYAGWPQIADPQSLIFVPAFFVLSLVHPDPGAVAMDATVFAMLGLGGLALAARLRDRDVHPAAAALAALSFAFGGSAAWRLQHTGQVMSYALIPVVWFLLARALERRSLGWGFASGLAAGFLAVGRDQIALLGLGFLVAWTLAELLSGERRLARVGGSIAPLGAGALGGLLVVVVPVVLTLLLAASSNRPAIDLAGADKGSLPPQALITAVIADLFGQGAPDVDFWGPPSPAFGITDVYLAQNMVALYAGALPIMAILMLGVARGGLLAKGIRFQAAAALFFVLYAVGRYTPAFALMYDWLPGVKLYRRPADATFLIGFSISVLGALLIDRALKGGFAPARLVQRLAQGAILIVVFAVLPIAFGLRAASLPLVWKPLVAAIVFSGVALVILAFGRSLAARGAGLALTLIVIAFTTVDLAWNNAPSESTAYPSSTFAALDTRTDDPVISFLKARVAETTSPTRRDRVELAGVGFHWPNAGMVHGLEHTLGYNPLRIREYAEATGAIDHVAIPEQKTWAPLNPSYDSLLGDMLGLRWIVTGVAVEKIDPKLPPGRLVPVARFPAVAGLEKAPGRPETFVYENPRALPRVLFVDAARSADFAEIRATGRWPERFDPRREVLIDGAAAVAPAGDAPAGRAALAAWHHAEVVVDVEAEKAGHVVLFDAFHPWWKAELDGRRVEIVRANVLFRAVAVEPGRHRIRMTFHPFEGAIADLRAGRLTR